MRILEELNNNIEESVIAEITDFIYLLAIG
jgi:hypothetical protein